MPAFDKGVQALIRSANQHAELERQPAEPDFEEVSRMRQELAEESARTARLELEQIKTLLAEKDAARRNAQQTLVVVTRQIKAYEADNNRLRRELGRARDELAVAKHQHHEELRLAGDRESAISAELVQLRHQLSGVTLEAPSAPSRKKWPVLAVSVAAAVLCLACIAKLSFTRDRASAIANTDSSSDSASSAGSAPPAAASPARDFSGAVGNLDDALGDFQGLNPADVLKMVHRENAARGVSVCSFEWNNGQVSLLFGSGDGNDPQVVVQRCADAVRKAALAGKALPHSAAPKS